MPVFPPARLQQTMTSDVRCPAVHLRGIRSGAPRAFAATASASPLPRPPARLPALPRPPREGRTANAERLVRGCPTAKALTHMRLPQAASSCANRASNRPRVIHACFTRLNTVHGSRPRRPAREPGAFGSVCDHELPDTALVRCDAVWPVESERQRATRLVFHHSRMPVHVS